VKPVIPTGYEDERGTVRGSRFVGHLGPAPPVYDPGGPVLLVRQIDPAAPLGELEQQASAWGAVLVIVPEVPSGPRVHELIANGYEVASQWFVGIPEELGAPT
jgi:hypothetical protein